MGSSAPKARPSADISLVCWLAGWLALRGLIAPIPAFCTAVRADYLWRPDRADRLRRRHARLGAPGNLLRSCRRAQAHEPRSARTAGPSCVGPIPATATRGPGVVSARWGRASPSRLKRQGASRHTIGTLGRMVQRKGRTLTRPPFKAIVFFKRPLNCCALGRRRRCRRRRRVVMHNHLERKNRIENCKCCHWNEPRSGFVRRDSRSASCT